MAISHGAGPPRSARKSLRIDADFTEEAVGFALESFLTLLSFPNPRYTIEPFSQSAERIIGADARLLSRIRGFRPFYMQFKRPAAYPDFSLSKIITDRETLGLDRSPRALFFSLREKRPTHADYQHNILYRLRQSLLARNRGDAAYVCPLFLDRAAYRHHLHLAGLNHWLRFWRREPWMRHGIGMPAGGHALRFDRVPIFAEHISVPPHALVSDAKHSYSFTEAGTDLCFHSPNALPDGTEALGKFLRRQYLVFYEGRAGIELEQADRVLWELMDAVGDARLADGKTSDVKALDGAGPLGRWLAWGDRLRTEHGIEQYALVEWEDEED